jgi:hypothetical protein
MELKIETAEDFIRKECGGTASEKVDKIIQTARLLALRVTCPCDYDTVKENHCYEKFLKVQLEEAIKEYEGDQDVS